MKYYSVSTDTTVTNKYFKKTFSLYHDVSKRQIQVLSDMIGRDVTKREGHGPRVVQKN